MKIFFNFAENKRLLLSITFKNQQNFYNTLTKSKCPFWRGFLFESVVFC